MGIERNYTLIFKTVKEGDGIEKTTEDIKGLKSAAESVAPVQQKAADATGKLDFETRKLGATVESLNQGVPSLTGAVGSMQSTFLVAAPVIAAFVSLMQQLIEKQNELAKSASDAAVSMSGLEGVVNRTKENLRDSTAQADSLAKALAKLDEEANGADEQLKDENEDIKQRLDLDLKHLENQRKLAHARLEANKGAMDPGAFILAGASIDDKYGSRAAERKHLASNEKIGAMARFKDRGEEDAATALDERRAAEKVLREKKNQLKNFDRFENEEGGAAEQRKKALKQAKEDESAAQLEVAKYSHPEPVNFVGGPQAVAAALVADEYRKKQLAKAQEKLESSRQEQKHLQDAGRERSDARAAIAADVDTAEGAFKAAQGAVVSNTRRVGRLGREIGRESTAQSFGDTASSDDRQTQSLIAQLEATKAQSEAEQKAFLQYLAEEQKRKKENEAAMKKYHGIIESEVRRVP